MPDQPVEDKISDLLKDFNVEDKPKERYTRIRTQSEQVVTPTGGAGYAPDPLYGCTECGVAVWDPALHDKDHKARQRRSRMSL